MGLPQSSGKQESLDKPAAQSVDESCRTGWYRGLSRPRSAKNFRVMGGGGWADSSDNRQDAWPPKPIVDRDLRAVESRQYQGCCGQDGIRNARGRQRKGEAMAGIEERT